MLEDFDTICDFPSHIYSSALQLCPTPSWLQHYNMEESQEVQVVKGPSARWGTCFRTVPLDSLPQALACWKDIIAVGLWSDEIITLSVVTGNKIAVLSGHTSIVTSLAFLPDGTSLVSGSYDETIKLWDMQTGGVVKTFQGHTGIVSSVSISVDCTTIASGSADESICLWDIQTGECHCIIQQESHVKSVHFLPWDSQHLISISGDKLWQWNVDGHKVAPEYDCSHTAFSSDGTKLAMYDGEVVQVQSTDSGVVVAEFYMDDAETSDCCFSPDGNLVAVAANYNIYVWDITNSEPCLIETFISHTSTIASLVFSSPTSLISAPNLGGSVNFWKIGTSSTSPDVTDLESTPHTSPIKSITLQAKDGIAISSDSDGVVRIWDLSTGLCKTSFQTPAKGFCLRDVQLIDNRLVLVWYAAGKIHIWDIEKEELLQTVDAPYNDVRDLRISGDGSKILCMEWLFIQAWYIWTGEVMGKVELHDEKYGSTFLTMDGSKVWVNFPKKGIEGWDFGVLDPSSIKHYTGPPNRPHLDFIGGIRRCRTDLPGIEDTITGKKVFQLPSRYTRPDDVQWDGQYLVAGYDTGEVLILDCNCTLSH